MKLVKPGVGVDEVANGERRSDDDLIQRLKFKTYEAALEGLEARSLSVDRISAGVLREEIGRALELVLAVNGGTLGITQRHRLIEDVGYELTGLGPIQPFLDDPAVEDIIVNGCNGIYVERQGELEKQSTRFRDDAHLMNIIQRIVGPIGRRVDESSPYVDARLPDGSRVNVIIPPVALDGPMLSIRKFREQPFRAKELVRSNTLSREMLAYLASAVQARLNILICGGTGSGKTTLLNMLSGFIGAKERVVTIEDAAEIRLQQRHVVRLETRPRNPENPATEVTARDLMRNALRMRPDRIILGEVRGNEAVDMLQAMGTGHQGSMATIHANNARDAIDRLEMLVGMTEMRAEPRTLRRYISSTIHVIVHVMRLTNGRRCVVSISELIGVEGDTYTLNDVHQHIDEGAVLEFGRSPPPARRSHFATRLKPVDLGDY